MKFWRDAGCCAARIVLALFALAVLVFTGAFAAVFVKHHGGDDTLQTIAFSLVAVFLIPALGWLIEKARL
jgi:hypothetical protein